MSKKLLLIICGVVITLAVTLAMCACTPEASYVEPEYAPPIAEGILLGINEADYASYSEHFNEDMKSVVTETTFMDLRAQLQDKIGSYVAREFWKTEEQGGYTVVYYKAEFTEEPEDVIVRVVVEEIEGEIYVAGLWFDSPKLREA